MPKPNLKKAQQRVDDWNRFNPVGVKVIVTKDNLEKFETTTRSEAQLLGGHTPVVWCEGIRGAYDLGRVEPVE